MVSIILPSYNKKDFLSQTIDSVLNQTYRKIELIILDDNSSDGTPLFLKELENSFPEGIKIHTHINKDNKGASFRRNQGIKLATGDYVLFLDADDLLNEDCLERRVHVMKQNQHLDFAVFGMQVFEKEKGDRKEKWLPTTANPLVDFLRHRMPWQTMQPIWKRDFLLNHGGFDASFARLQDVEFHTRILFIKGIQFLTFPDIIDCYYRIDENRILTTMFQFLQKYVDAMVQYYHKFYEISKKEGKEKYLQGTIFKAYLYITHYYKSRQINSEEFYTLKDNLLQPAIRDLFSSRGKNALKTAEFLHQLPFTIKGSNHLLYTLVSS